MTPEEEKQRQRGLRSARITALKTKGAEMHPDPGAARRIEEKVTYNKMKKKEKKPEETTQRYVFPELPNTLKGKRGSALRRNLLQGKKTPFTSNIGAPTSQDGLSSTQDTTSSLPRHPRGNIGRAMQKNVPHISQTTSLPHTIDSSLPSESQSEDQQNDWASDLRESEFSSAQQMSVQLSVIKSIRAIQESGVNVADSVTRDLDIQQTMQDASRLARTNPARARQQLQTLGKELITRVQSGDFRTFALMLILCLLKDLEPVLALGQFGWLLNFIVAPVLIAAASSEGSWFKKMIVKKFIGRIVTVILMEFIPGVEIIPAYTIGIILVKLQTEEEKKRNQATFEKIKQAAQLDDEGNARRSVNPPSYRRAA
jgi:hypothetical protein